MSSNAFINIKNTPQVTWPEPIPEVDYQALTNIACWLDVVTSGLSGLANPGAEDLLAALLEGAKYNNCDPEDLEELKPTTKEITTPDIPALCQTLCDLSAALISQLVLDFEEQHTLKQKRI